MKKVLASFVILVISIVLLTYLLRNYLHPNENLIGIFVVLFGILNIDVILAFVVVFFCRLLHKRIFYIFGIGLMFGILRGVGGYVLIPLFYYCHVWGWVGGICGVVFTLCFLKQLPESWYEIPVALLQLPVFLGIALYVHDEEAIKSILGFIGLTCTGLSAAILMDIIDEVGHRNTTDLIDVLSPRNAMDITRGLIARIMRKKDT